MSTGGAGDVPAPVAGAGSAQEVPELPVEEPPATFSPLPLTDGDTAPPLREDQIANAVSFLSHDKVAVPAVRRAFKCQWGSRKKVTMPCGSD